MNEAITDRTRQYFIEKQLCPAQLADQIDRMRILAYGERCHLMPPEHRARCKILKNTAAFYRLRALGAAPTTAEKEIASNPQKVVDALNAFGATIRQLERKHKAHHLEDVQQALDFFAFLIPLALAHTSATHTLN